MGVLVITALLLGAPDFGKLPADRILSLARSSLQGSASCLPTWEGRLEISQALI